MRDRLYIFCGRLSEGRTFVKEKGLSESLCQIVSLEDRRVGDRIAGLQKFTFVKCGSWDELPYRHIMHFLIRLEMQLGREVTSEIRN